MRGTRRLITAREQARPSTRSAGIDHNRSPQSNRKHLHSTMPTTEEMAARRLGKCQGFKIRHVGRRAVANANHGRDDPSETDGGKRSTMRSEHAFSSPPRTGRQNKN